MTNPFQHNARKKFTAQERAEVFALRGGCCHICKRKLGHRDPRTTRTVYAKADVDSMRPAAEVVDMRIRRKG